jgi:dTDP-4-dehydrorhamnose reductase
MIELAARQPSVDVVADQVGQPTWTRGTPAGFYHGTNAGRTSWYGLARQTFALLGADPDRVRPTPSAAVPRPAERPAFSVLGHDGWAAVGLPAMRDWREALAEAFPALLAAAQRSPTS